MVALERKIPIKSSENVTLMVYEWGDPQPDRPTVIFFHATGFHGHCWDAVVRRLPEYHCLTVDARGHGQSDKPAPPYPWRLLGQDAATLVTQLGLRDAIGVGHSMGGNSLTRAAAQVPEAFRALLLVDPVILPSAWYTRETASIDGHFVLNRRRQWSSPEEMFASFKGRGPFAQWQDEVLRDYCTYGLLPAEDGGYTLACPPEVEAHMYVSTAHRDSRDVYDAVAGVDIPVRVLRCENTVSEVGMDLLASPTAPDLASHFRQGVDIPLPDNTHFIPMESPDLVADHIRELSELDLTS
jgi:pimeloyl-ACP methyl ester carboxylesterase